MLRKALHSLVALPPIYDTVQQLVGADRIADRLAVLLPQRAGIARVLDLGGGTGISRDLLTSDMYICLDLDMQKLRSFCRNHPDDPALLADGMHVPLRDGSLDAILCKMVSHHLSDGAWAALLAESRRILKEDGLLIFVDAIWEPHQIPGRLLWSLDRGANPRRSAALYTAIRHQFQIEYWEDFAIYHMYVICLATKRSGHRCC